MIISFSCPHCGCHQLHQIRQALHRAEVRITTTTSGQLVPTPIGVVEELRGPILGYRCRKCRYPDNQNHEEGGGFYWPTPEAVHRAGCLTITTDGATVHRCMICHKDGTMEPLIVESDSPGTLSPEQRSKILTRRGVRGVLLSESDPGITAFACDDWAGVASESI
ncbi:MAG: hypothetical protein Q4F38_02870 [Akkermansia sp.]|nr:hypothetical protein [Akkermansia sp.]